MKENKETGDEQRHFTRMEIDAPAEILIMTPESQRLPGICRDLSAGGMLLETQQTIPAGSRVRVTLRSHYGDKTMLSCEARVVRSDPAADGTVILGLEVLQFLD